MQDIICFLFTKMPKQLKVLVLDNYDSFTYNLVHLIEKVSDCALQVYRNDKIELDAIETFDKIVLSPGPGLPSAAGIMPALIKAYASHKSILGVCLGHQAIAEAFGGSLFNLDTVFHGVATPVEVIEKDSLFSNIPDIFNAGRYHSWVVREKDLPETIEVIARDEYGNIMAMRHKIMDVKGVQFHPESILTEFGEELISNWLKS